MEEDLHLDVTTGIRQKDAAEHGRKDIVVLRARIPRLHIASLASLYLINIF